MVTEAAHAQGACEVCIVHYLESHSIALMTHLASAPPMDPSSVQFKLMCKDSDVNNCGSKKLRIFSMAQFDSPSDHTS